MYLIKYNCSFPKSQYKWTASYFIGFGVWGLREYGHKNDAMRFSTRDEAKKYLVEVLNNPKDHSIIKEGVI